MGMSPLALQAKRVIENAWLHGAPYDLASQAAFALESAQLLQSPETAAQSAVSADAVRLAEESVAELRREHEENARLREALRKACDEVARLESELGGATARVAELERPAVEAKRREVRSSYSELIAQAEEDRDHEGAFALTSQLRERERQWQLEDPHDGPLAHTYRLGRDLPEMGSV